ncbi:MAG TPA: spore coat protein YlbD [Haloplasmataceae bacterium]
MGTSIEEFKEFVKQYPRLKYEVREGKRTWQSIYEEWTLLGDDGSWDAYKEVNNNRNSSGEGQEFIHSALKYIKKLNPDDITKTINTVQKVLGIVQSFNSGRKPSNRINYTPRRRVDPLFRRFDDYDD